MRQGLRVEAQSTFGPTGAFRALFLQMFNMSAHIASPVRTHREKGAKRPICTIMIRASVEGVVITCATSSRQDIICSLSSCTVACH